MQIKYKKLNYDEAVDAVNFAYYEMVNNNQIEDNFRNRTMFIKLNLAEVDAGKLIIYASFVQNKIIGVIGYTDDSINILFVNKNYQRRGIATKLLKLALDDLKRKKVDTIKIDSTKEGYEFYKALGFVDTESDNDKYINMIYNTKDAKK